MGTVTRAVSLCGWMTRWLAIIELAGPENWTVAPARKPEPVKVTPPAAPAATFAGFAAVTVGWAKTVKQALQVPDPPASVTVTWQARLQALHADHGGRALCFASWAYRS
jgi:hypothetical protein